MKNKIVLFFLYIFIFGFLLDIFSTISSAESSDINTYSPHCILMESSTRESYLRKKCI